MLLSTFLSKAVTKTNDLFLFFASHYDLLPVEEEANAQVCYDCVWAPEEGSGWSMPWTKLGRNIWFRNLKELEV